MPLLSEEQLEAGAARLAKSLTLPGTRSAAERLAVYKRVAEFLVLLHDAGHACSASTAEDFLWAAASMEEWKHALHWMFVLAEFEHPVLQWQQLPDVLSQLVAQGVQVNDAACPAQTQVESLQLWAELELSDMAELVIHKICPQARQAMVLDQFRSRTGGPTRGSDQASGLGQAGGLDALLGSDDSDSGSDQDIEDMVFSDESDDEQI